MAKASGKSSIKPPFGGQVGVPGSSGMYVGGLTDQEARTNANSTGKMLQKQLKKNKSKGATHF
jgi:hypothetical protein